MIGNTDKSGKAARASHSRGSALPVLVALTALGGCAAYHPAPLAAASDVLAPPVLAVLSARAQAIDRPFLKPQPIDLSQPLTPNALGVIAVLENPDLRALRSRVGVTEAQAFAARLLPDPSAFVGFDKLVSGPDVLNGFAGQLGLDIGALRRRRVNAAAAAAARERVRLDIAWAEWQTAGAARLQGVRILALERQAGFARASAASAERLLAITQRAAGRGDIAGPDVETRRLAALNAADRLRINERDLGVARFELNRRLGLPPQTQILLAPVVPALAPPTVETLVARATERRLDLRALQAGYAVSEADVRRAIIDQFPNLSVTLAGARDTGGNSTVGPRVGLSLPLWNRNRGGIALTTATREQLRTEYEARLFQTRSEIAGAIGSIQSAQRQRVSIVAALPRLQQFATATARAAARGDLAQVTADGAAQSLRDRQAALAALDQQAAEAAIALELFVGEPSEVWTR